MDVAVSRFRSRASTFPVARLISTRADSLRRALRQSGAVPVIPGRSSRKRPVRYDRERYKERHLIDNAFCRLKDFRRVATRYDKLATNFPSDIALATALAFWL